MPNPTTHVQMAYRAAQLVDAPVIERNIGCYLLGSTAPDVRVITKKGREPYHFASLDFDEVGAGITGLFDQHPELVTIDHEATRAFVAGYVSHLILDETWITKMYRPYFGVDGLFETKAYGAVMDRAMQLELDSVVLDDFDGRLEDLAKFEGGVTVPFIDTDTLTEWHRWVSDFVAQEFSWGRLRFMARRIARSDDSHPAHRIADDFVLGMPGTLDGLHEVVPTKNLEDFKQDAISEMARRVEEYLG
jgi:hypothetical protein